MNKKTIIAVAVLFALVIVVGSTLWIGEKKQGKKMVELKQSEKQVKNTTKTEMENEAQSGVESEGSYESAGNGMYWFIVKEMGIKFKVRKELKDDRLVYYYEKNVPTPAIGKLAESVKFSTKELERIDEICSTKELPLGVFIKLSGTKNDYKDNEYIISRNPKQVEAFILYYNGPDAPCTNSDELTKKYKQYDNFLPNAFNSIQSIE